MSDNIVTVDTAALGLTSTSGTQHKPYERLHDLYEIYRDYMKHEDDLVNQRSTWHNVIQGFLFSVLGVIDRWQFSQAADPLLIQRIGVIAVIAVTGIRIARSAKKSILAAQDATIALEDKWKIVGKDLPGYRLLPDIAGGGADGAKIKGIYAALHIPSLIIFAWSLVLGLIAIDLIRIAYLYVISHSV